MTQTTTGSASLAEHFSTVADPRLDRTKRHQLIDIIIIAICAVICGATSWDDIELFGHTKQAWLKKFLVLPNGIPSHDTFNRVFTHLDPEQFRTSFMSWIRALVTLTHGDVVAIDGKTVRRSHDHTLGKDAIHMVSAFAAANGLALGQLKVDGKSNEITAIPKLLRLLELSGCIVTIDAMGCQKEIAKTIIERGADYVLAVKGNQPMVYDDIQRLFAQGHRTTFAGWQSDAAATRETSHGRTEVRRCQTISEPRVVTAVGLGQSDWPGLRSLGEVTCERTIRGITTTETRYFLSSLGGNATELLSATRQHWRIENSLHWVLDVTFREDESRIRAGAAAENFAVLRHIALNLLRQETSTRRSVKGKQLQAALSERYLEKVVGI